MAICPKGILELDVSIVNELGYHPVRLTEAAIAECERRSAGEPVHVIRIRHASSIPEPTLKQAFQMLAEGGSLAEATLEAETCDVHLCCAASPVSLGMTT